MNTHTIAIAALALLAPSCASAPPPDYSLTPPAPGPDIYRCVEDNGHARFVLVKAGTHQSWLGDHWGDNACADPINRCKTDETGLIVIERTFMLPSSRSRLDTIDIYNPKAGTVLSTVALNGIVGEPHRDTCAPHSS